MYFCTRPRLMIFLKEKGFEPVDTVPNKYKPDMVCWRFVKTPALMDAVNQFYNSLNN